MAIDRPVLLLDFLPNRRAVGVVLQPHDCEKHELLELAEGFVARHFNCIVEEIEPTRQEFGGSGSVLGCSGPGLGSVRL